MNKTLRKALIITFFMICIFALAVVGASAASATYDTDADAVAAGYALRIAATEGAGTTYYDSIVNACAAATSGDTIYVVGDFTANTEGSTGAKTLTITGVKKGDGTWPVISVTASNCFNVQGGADITVKNLTINGTTTGNIGYATGKLTFTDVAININSPSGDDFGVAASGHLIFGNGCNVTVTKQGNRLVVINGTCTIDGATITLNAASNNPLRPSASNSKLNIKSGTITNNTTQQLIYVPGSLTGVEINMEGGEINQVAAATIFLITSPTTIDISGDSEITQTGAAKMFDLSAAVTVNISGNATITQTGASGDMFAPASAAAITINISGGELSKTGSGRIIAATVTTTVINISGGSLSHSGSANMIEAACPITITGGTFIHSGTGDGGKTTGNIIYNASAAVSITDANGSVYMKHTGSGNIIRNGGGKNPTISGRNVSLVTTGTKAYVLWEGWGASITDAYVYTEAPRFCQDNALGGGDYSLLKLVNVSCDSDLVAAKFDAIARIGNVGRLVTIEGETKWVLSGYYKTSVPSTTNYPVTMPVAYTAAFEDAAKTLTVYLSSLTAASANVFEGAKIYASGATDESASVVLSVNGFSVTLYYTGDTEPTADSAFGAQVARVDESGNLYTIPYAEKLVANGGTIYITADFTHTAGQITLASGKAFSIVGDAAVKTITCASGSAYLFEIGAGTTVTMDDLAITAIGAVFHVYGTLNLNDGVSVTGSIGAGYYVLRTEDGSVTNLNGTTITITLTHSSNNESPFYMNGGNTTMTGATITITTGGRDYWHVQSTAAVLTLNGGTTITVYGTGDGMETHGTVIIDNASIYAYQTSEKKAYSNSFYVPGNGRIYIYGGTIRGKSAGTSGYFYILDSDVYMPEIEGTSEKVMIAEGAIVVRVGNPTVASTALTLSDGTSVNVYPTKGYYYVTLEAAVAGATVNNNVLYLLKNYTTHASLTKNNALTNGYTVTSIDPANITLTVGSAWLFDLGDGSAVVPTLTNIRINVGSNNLGYFNNVTVIINEGAYIYGVGNSNGLIYGYSKAHITVNGGTIEVTSGANNMFQLNSGSYVTITGGTFRHAGSGAVVYQNSAATSTVSGVNTKFEISGSASALRTNAASGIINVSGGTFENSGSGYLVYVSAASAEINVTDGTFTHSGTGHVAAVTNTGVITLSGGTYVHTGTGCIGYVNSGSAKLLLAGGAYIHEGPTTTHNDQPIGYILYRGTGAIRVESADASKPVLLIAKGSNYIFEQGYQNTVAGFTDGGKLTVKDAYLSTERTDGSLCAEDPTYLVFANVMLDSDAVAAALTYQTDYPAIGVNNTKNIIRMRMLLAGQSATLSITIPAYGENAAEPKTVYQGYYLGSLETVLGLAPADNSLTTLIFIKDNFTITREGGIALTAGQNILLDGQGYTITLNESNGTFFMTVPAGAALAVKDLNLVGCPTKFANVAGTLHLQSGATLTCTANGSTSETTPIIYLSGTATLTIDQSAGIYTVYPDGVRVEGEPSYINNPHVIDMAGGYTGTITIGGTISHKWDTTGDWGPIFRIRGDATIVILSTAVLEFDTTAAAAGGNAMFLEANDGKATLTVAAGAQITSTTYPIFYGDGIFFDSDESAFNFNPNYTVRIGTNRLWSSYHLTYIDAINAVPASGTATIYLLVDVVGAHADLAYSFTVDSQTITLSGVLKEDGKTYTSLTTTGSSKDELFTFNTNGVETYLTFANINITVAGPLLFGDCPGSTLTLDAGAVLRTAETLSGTYLIMCYDWVVITLNAGARIDTTGSTVTGDYQLINFYGGSAITNANAAVNINGEIVFALAGPQATSQLRVFSMTEGFAGTITIGTTANITYAPTNAKLGTSGVFVAYANIEINGGTFTMGVYDEAGPDTATVGYLIFFDGTVKTVNINGGTFTNYTNNNMYNGGGANLNIKGGSMTAHGSGKILNVTGGTVTVSGDAELAHTGTGHVIYSAAAGTVNISGGTLAHSGSQVIMDSYGTVNITGGELDYTGSYQMLKLRGTTTISGGTFTNTSAAGSNTMIESSGTTTISGTASFECKSTGMMFNVWGGSLTVDGGSFETATASAIISNSYPVTIAGGRFEHSGAGNILNAGSGEITNVSATESLVVFKHTGSGMIFNNPSNKWIHVDGGASSNVQILAEGTSQVFFDGYCATVANAYIYVADTAKYVSASGDDLTYISYQNVMFDNNTAAAKMYAYLRVGNGTATITVDGQQRTVYTGYYGFQFDADEAIAAAIDGGKTLYLIKTPDQSLARGITVEAGKTLTIDGNGFTQSVADVNDVFFLEIAGSVTLQNITLTVNGLFANVAGGASLTLGDNATVQGNIHDTGSTYRGYINLNGDAPVVTINASANVTATSSSAGKEAYVIQNSGVTNAVITHRGTITVNAGVTTSNVDIINFTGTCTGSTVYIYGSIINHMTNARNHRLVDANAGTNVYVYEGATLTEDGTGNTASGALILSAGTVTISGGSFVTKGAGHVLSISGTATITGGTMVHYGTGEVIRYTATTAAVSVSGNTTLIHQGGGESFIIRRTGGGIKIDGDNVKLIARGENYIFRQGYCNTVAGITPGGRMTVKGAYLSTEREDKSICYGEVSYIDFINVKVDSREAAAGLIGYTADPNGANPETAPVSLLFFYTGGTATISIPATEGRDAVASQQVAAGFYSKLSEVWATVTTSGTHTITVVNDYTVKDADAKTFDGAYTIVLQGVENGEGGYTKLTETISALFLNIKRGTNLTTKNLHIVSDGSLIQVDAGGTKTYLTLGENTKVTTAATVRNGDLFLLWNVGYITVTESAVIDTTGSTVSGRLQMIHAQGNAFEGEVRIEGTIIHALTCTGDSKIVRFSSKTGTVTVTSTANITYACTGMAASAENAIFHNYPGSGVSIYEVCYTYNIEGGTITHSSATGSFFYGAGYGAATLNLKGGTVNITGGGNLAHLTYGSEIRVTGGTVNVSGSYLISGDRSGAAYVSGGTINLTNGAVMMKNAESVYITGGTFTADASSKGATSAADTVGVTIKDIAFADDATAAKLLANFRAGDKYYSALGDALATGESTIYVVGNGMRKVDRTAGGFAITGNVTLQGVDGLGVMNVNGMNDTYLFVVNGELVLENVTLTNCPTKLASVSGTLTMNGVTAELFSKRDNEAAVHETSPFIYLQGAGVATLDANTAVNFTYADDDDTHDAVDYQASIYVFHTASDWTGTLTIAGSVEMGWNVRGYSAIFYLESTAGTIAIKTGASVRHTATEGASDNALLVSPVKDGNDNGNNPGTTTVNVEAECVIEILHFEAIRDGHINAVTTAAKAVFQYEGDTISVIITWEDAIHFTYDRGTWDPENLTYVGGGWKPTTTNSNIVTVQNAGDVAVDASFAYSKNGGYEDINGSFTADGMSNNTLALPVGGEACAVTLTLSGDEPDAAIDNQTIGVITITITVSE